jgi:copper chaperone CopZ
MNMRIAVGGMNCGHCTAQVKKTLEALAPGLTVEVDLASGEASLSGDALPVDAELQAAVERIGFRWEGRRDG